MIKLHFEYTINSYTLYIEKVIQIAVSTI